MSKIREKLRGSTDLVVLSVLAEEPRHGYGISKVVVARSGGEISLSSGVMYPLLHKLESEGLVEASWDPPVACGQSGKGGRRRKWYQITDKGRKKLTRDAEVHRAFQAVLEAFLPPSAEGVSQ